jgi:Icc-related predicted phosphoesterase
MLVLADVHAGFDALARVAATGEPLLILGDFLNFIDYRTGHGMAEDVYGFDHTRQLIENRRTSNWDATRALWLTAIDGREDEMRSRINAAVAKQHAEVTAALEGANAYVIHGNVDWPDDLQAALPEGVQWVDGQVIELEGYSIGFAGGGVPTPVGARGEVSHEEMAEKLSGLGGVDILCTHVAPSIAPLHRDVITGRLERSSDVVLDFVTKHQPRFHYFGDVHQPQALTWQVGLTTCRNVGYFRATGRPVQHD